MLEWNEVSLQLLQAWVVIIAVGIVLLTLIVLFILALLGYGKARMALLNIRSNVDAYMKYVDDPDDLVIQRIVEFAALLRLKMDPVDAAKVLPGFIKVIGETLGENENASPVSKLN